ncbi:MAG: hypothetical protein H6Q73_2632 [Firmicutes bacterium]|nr:hypothetical protein [Bacillota bacterium]
MFKRQPLIAITLFLSGIIIWGTIHWLPLKFFFGPQKSPELPSTVYDYYQVIDEKTSQPLMHVPMIVNIGDEVITEDNKRYRVVKVEENRAYARFIEYINLERYHSPP